MRIQALLVGGPADVKRDLERHLDPLGVDISDHWEYRGGEARGRIVPQHVEIVIALVDMGSHDLFNRAKREAGRAGVPFVHAHRKWSISSDRIAQAISKLRPNGVLFR